MPTPNATHLYMLHRIADETRESFAEAEWVPGAVMDVHPSQDCSRVQSASTRAVLVHAILDASARVGMPRVRSSVDCCELGGYTPDSLHDQRFRVLQATRRADGSLYVPANGQSGLVPSDGLPQQPPAFELDQWVFAVTWDDNGLPDEIVAAHVVGADKGSPGRLIFDEEIPLGAGHGLPPASFIPDADDTLEGLDEDNDGDEDYGSAAS